ncbi:uncharacterized protein LOC143256004 isoform X2 [Tachypleus tridentatus]|uniref:uncharacterized protein LOC143256004 isoform X2 n=1 Tax=Tachypleus tridentatus TaxID=6853 RepID=UPI003FD13306
MVWPGLKKWKRLLLPTKLLRNGRRNKNKSALDGSRDFSNIPRETTRPPRAVRDTRQVHPQEAEKINVIGRDCTIVVTNYGDYWESVSKDHKEPKESDVWQLKSQQFVFDEIQKDSVEDFRDSPIPDVEGCQGIDCPVEYNSKESKEEDKNYGYFVKDESSQYFQTNVTFDESSSENCKESSGGEERDGHSEPSSSCIKSENVVEHNLNGSSIVFKKNIEKHLDGFCHYINTKKCDGGCRSEKNGEYLETVHFADGLPESRDEGSKFEVEREKMDSIKNAMERKIAEFRCLLDQERENVRQEKRNVGQLQREINSKKSLRTELEIEKMHRLEAEACLREVRLESEQCKARLASLQEDFLKMEEMIKNMLQFKSRIDQLKHEKSSLALTYEIKIRKYQTCLASLEKENLMLLNELHNLEGSNKDYEQKREQTLCRVLLERLGLLEQENTALIIENEQQRLQYEHCLDDVANQVVQALLTQKSLQEECGKLQRRVQDLEQQNKALSVLFKQQLLHSGEFQSQLYHRDSLQKIWPSADNSPDQDTVDMILANRLQNLEFGQNNQDQNQRTGRNFQSRANHSEDSTDSLASLCSDYSFNSGYSGRNVLSYPGLPNMSSPPQWSQDSLSTLGYSVKPQVSSTGVLARSFLTSTPHGHHRTSMTKCWSDLVPRPSDQDCYSRDEVHNYALQAEQLELRESHKPNKSYGTRNLLDGKVCGRIKNNVARSNSLLNSEIHQAEYNLNSQSQSADLGSLDTIETPSEHILTLESLPYLTTSQRLLISKGCKFPNVSHTYQGVQTTSADVYHKSSTNRHSSCLPQMLHHNYFALPSGNLVSSKSDICKSETSVQRPTTLNVVPFVQCETSHSFSFPALEQKLHDTCVNVYEEVDPPSFSADTNSVSRTSTDANSMASPNRKSLENWYTSESSPKINSLGEECTNTVIRRSQVGHGMSEDNEYCTVPKDSQNVSFSEVKTEVQPESIPVFSPLKSMKECSETSRALNQQPQTHCSKEIQQSNIRVHSSERQDPESSITFTANASLVPVERGGKDEGYSTMSSDVQTEVNMASNSVGKNQDHTTDTDPAPPKYVINAVDVDSAMVSSSDSGLGLLQCPQSQKQLSENHEDGCVGFERDLDNSLIRSERIVSSTGKNQVTGVSPTSPKSYDKDRIHFDSGLGDSPPVLRLTSFSEPEKKSSLQFNQSSLDSSYDKILNLLTPQGFKTGRSDARQVTYPAIKLPPTCQIETAEKSTSMDLLCLGLNVHSDSSLSVSSVGSGGRVKVLKELKEKQQVCRETATEYNKFSCSESSVGMKNSNRNLRSSMSISSVEADYSQKAFSEDNTYQNIHCESALRCQYPSTYKNHIFHSRCQSCLEWPVASLTLNSSNIRKFVSDSCLYIKEHAEYLFQDLMKLDPPLEHHTSVQNLTYPSPVFSSGFVPGLRRTHCRVLVDQRQNNTKLKHQISPKTDCQNRKKCEQDPSHSISLSSIKSSASEHSGSEGYEEYDISNQKYSRDYHLSSESEDECNLVEDQSFVQQWLQEDDSRLQESVKDFYSYDEEEIGNWTFQLSIEDVSQPTCDSWDLTLPVQENFNKIHLGRIEEESTAEDVYEEELWNNTVWTDSSGQQELPHLLVATNNDSNPKLTDIPTSEENDKDMVDSPHNDKFDKSCHCSMSTSIKENSAVLLDKHLKIQTYPMFFKSMSLPNLKFTWNIIGEYENNQEYRMNQSAEYGVNDRIPNNECSSGVIEEENCDDEVIPTDTSEFNRDFYRLCPLGSNKSLNDSPRTLPKSKSVSPTEQVNHFVMPLLSQKSYSKDLDSFPEEVSKYKGEDSLKRKEISTESLSTLKEQCSKHYVNCVKSSPKSELVNTLEEKGSPSVNLLSPQKHVVQGCGQSFIEDFSARKQELVSLSDEYPETSLQSEPMNVSQQVNISSEMLAEKHFATNLDDSLNNISDSEPCMYIEQNDLDIQHQNTGIEVSYSCISERKFQETGEHVSDPCTLTSNSPVLKDVSHQNVEYELNDGPGTILQQEENKVYGKESSRRETLPNVQDKKIAQNVPVEAENSKESVHVKGNPAQDLYVISKLSHKLSSKKSKAKVVSRSSDFQSSIHFREKGKLNKRDKSKIPIITKSPTHRRSHSSVNSVNFIISSDKQNIDRRKVAKDKYCSSKYPQFQHQVAEQVGQSPSRLNGGGRKLSPETRRNPQKCGFRREFDSEGKDIKVFLKEKPKPESKSREDVHMKQKHSNQLLERDCFPKKEKGKCDSFKDLLIPKENVTFNFDNVPDLSVADKIQHLNSLLAESEKERKCLIPSLKQSEIHRPEVVQEYPRTESASERAVHTCRQETEKAQECGDKEGCGTSWIHVEADVDLSDPKARAKLLDSMMASSSSSSEEDDDEVQEHQHNQRLHALHRFRRHKKLASNQDDVISFMPRIRTSIINSLNFFYRFGEKEREAVACFDFLDEFSTSPSEVGSSEILNDENLSITPVIENNNIILPQESIETSNILHPFDVSVSSFAPLDHLNLESTLTCSNRRLTESCLSSMTLLSQDGGSVDHISFSDSCAESYSSSTHSLNRMS